MKGPNPTSVIHIVVWLSAVGVPLVVFPFYTQLGERNFGLFIPPKLIGDALTATFFYLNFYRFTPAWIASKRSGRFVFVVVISFLLLVAFDILYFQWLIKPVLHYESVAELPGRRQFGMNQSLTPIPKLLGIVFYFVVALVISSALAIRRHQRQQQAWQQAIELAKVTAELSVLKLQISPHFLFNTLNNIRSLVRKKSDKAEEAIIRLSNLLRYMLYQSQSDTVPLSKEIECLNDFIALQKLRLSRPDDVSFSVTGPFEEVYIKPLLFIPFIENAFKHGVHAGQSSMIRFVLAVRPPTIYFESRNSLGSNRVDVDEDSGIGLENVRKRLALYYPNQHTLLTEELDGEFWVKMEISYRRTDE